MYGTQVTITPNVDAAPWTDLGADTTAGALERVGILPEGMESGRASVALVVRLPDGSAVIAETSLRLFRVAARAILATPIAVGEPLDD